MANGTLTVDDEEKPKIKSIKTATKNPRKPINRLKTKSIVVKEEEPEEILGFNLLVQKIRRKHMIDAIISSDPEKKATGTWILKNVARLLNAKKSIKSK